MSGSRSSVRAQGDQKGSHRSGLWHYGRRLAVGWRIFWLELHAQHSVVLYRQCHHVIGCEHSMGLRWFVQRWYHGLYGTRGATAVLVSYMPVTEAWVAAGVWPWAFFASMLISIIIGVAALRLMPKGRNRLWVVGLWLSSDFLCRVGFISKPRLIEAVNPAGTGFLGAGYL